jgi:hypothetical protein
MLTLHLTDHSIVPSCPIPSCMARLRKHLCPLMIVLSLTTPVRNKSNKVSVVSCTMHGLLIQQYSWHYPTSPLNKPLLLRTPRSELTNSFTTCGLIPIQRSATAPITLNVHSDASYLSAPCAHSHTSGYFFLGSLPDNGNQIKLNGTILITCTILKLVAASATKAELGALFLNAQEAKVLRLTLDKLGHPQPPTIIHIDNTTNVGIVNNTIKRQHSCAMEMRYFWLLDGKTQQYFKFYYQPGQENLGDCPSKHHTAHIHKHVRPCYAHTNKSPTSSPRP